MYIGNQCLKYQCLQFFFMQGVRCMASNLGIPNKSFAFAVYFLSTAVVGGHFLFTLMNDYHRNLTSALSCPTYTFRKTHPRLKIFYISTFVIYPLLTYAVAPRVSLAEHVFSTFSGALIAPAHLIMRNESIKNHIDFAVYMYLIRPLCLCQDYCRDNNANIHVLLNKFQPIKPYILTKYTPASWYILVSYILSVLQYDIMRPSIDHVNTILPEVITKLVFQFIDVEIYDLPQTKKHLLTVIECYLSNLCTILQNL